MGLKFKPGQRALQVVKPIEGIVAEAAVVGDDVHYRVEWVNEEGHETAKWFAEDQLVLHPQQPAPVGEEQTITAGDVGDLAAVVQP